MIQAMQEMGSTLQPTRNFILSRFPAEVIDECATMLRQRASQAGIAEQDLYSLLVIGMATWELERTSLCRFCPRFALVGTAFCLEHGQGKQLPGTPGEKAARYRSGKEVAQEYHYYLPQTPAYILLSERTIPSFLARLMIGRPIPDEGRSLRAIKRKIAGSRRLVEIIGMDFQSLSESQLYRRLRERIDPGEARPRVWLWKLGRLYHWYGYEDRIALIKNLSVNNG
ncbi:MAG: hypothetical protein HT580_17000 [Dechloromonas sp.]|nr:MAG: hypothetical protein HT580_17000 [Dechloromonas sp.]